MIQKIIHFIKYHNAFTICFMLVFVGFSVSLAASPDLRGNFISSKETVRSVDNTGIINADLDNLNSGLRIKSVTEDEKNYYIAYIYKTLAVKNYIWQEVAKETILTVDKKVLGGKDLGLYVAEELGEVINYELSYLKEVQSLEKGKGLAKKIVTTQYAGLVGRFLSPEEKVFEGYQPVVQESKLESIPKSEPRLEVSFQPAPSTQAEVPAKVKIVEKPVDKEQIRRIVVEMLLQYREEPADEEGEPQPEVVPEPEIPVEQPAPAPAPEPTPESTTVVEEESPAELIPAVEPAPSAPLVLPEPVPPAGE